MPRKIPSAPAGAPNAALADDGDWDEAAASSSGPALVRIAPLKYIHVQDSNTSVTSVVAGPQSFLKEEHLRILTRPLPFVIVPANHYALIENPVVRDGDGVPVMDAHGQAKLRYGEREVRFSQDPFVLYPGEVCDAVEKQPVIAQNSALHLIAEVNFTDEDGVARRAGDEWLVEGPCLYRPSAASTIVRTLDAFVLEKDEALRLRARIATTDRLGRARMASEEYLVTHEDVAETGSYLPLAYEELVQREKACVLTENLALSLTASRRLTDRFGVTHPAGDRWLVTVEQAESYIPGVGETLVSEVHRTHVSEDEFCVLLNELDPETRLPRVGHRTLITGPASFFLRAGEELERGRVFKKLLLESTDAALLRARRDHDDGSAVRWSVADPTNAIAVGIAACVWLFASPTSALVVLALVLGILAMTNRGPPGKRVAGERWLAVGPRSFVPSLDVDVVEIRRAAIAYSPLLPPVKPFVTRLHKQI